jgi:hypothetical protein
MPLPLVPTDSNNEKQHRTVLATTVNELVKVRPPFDATEAEAAATVRPVDFTFGASDVLRHGAKGDGSTDDTDAIQRAFNAARRGYGRVHFPSRNRNGQTVYRCTGIAVYEGTHVTADHGVIIEKSGGAAFSHIFDCISTLGSATALTGDVAKRGASVVVTSASGLSVGQLVIIRDEQYKFSTSGRNLELNEIDSISGTTITLRNRLIGAYLTADNAELVPVTTPSRRIKFENVNCNLPSGIAGGAFYFQEAYDCEVLNCGCTGMEDQGAVQTWRSAYIRINGGRYTDGQDQDVAGTGYAISIGEACHHVVAYGVFTRNVRENAMGLNARHCGFSHCICVSPYDSGFNSHANGTEDCFIEYCEVYSSRSFGIVCGFAGSNAPDKRIRVIGCKVYDCGNTAFLSTADSGEDNEDIEFIDCVAINPSVGSEGSYGFYVQRGLRPKLINCRVIGINTNVRAGMLIELSTNAVVRGGEVRDLPDAWGIIHENCTGIEIAGVSFFSVSGQNIHSTGTDSTAVRVHDCQFDDSSNTRDVGNMFYNNYGYMTGSDTYDPGSLADGAGVTTTVTCTGAEVGDMAEAGFSNALQGISVTAWVSSGSTVSVRFQNESGGVLDLASGTLRVSANRYS